MKLKKINVPHEGMLIGWHGKIYGAPWQTTKKDIRHLGVVYAGLDASGYEAPKPCWRIYWLSGDTGSVVGYEDIKWFELYCKEIVM